MLILYRGLLCFAALGIAVLTASATRPSRRSSLPNFIIIVADDLGEGEIGNGARQIKTPNLDQLAAQGMSFTQAYAGAPTSAPSRAALLTGQNASHSRVRSETQVPLAPSDVTLAEVLRSVGYRNAAIGLWGLGWEGTTGHPNAQGFDEFLGYLDLTHGRDDQPAFLWRNQEPFTLAGNVGSKRSESGVAWLWRGVTNFVRISEDRAFFLYYAPNLPGSGTQRGNLGRSLARAATNYPTWTPAEQARAARITELDEQVGFLLADLRQRKLDSDTLILFTSAPARTATSRVRTSPLGDPFTGRPTEHALSERSLRVPFLAWWPGRIKAGTTNERPIAAWDLLPTIAELVGTPRPESIDGRSLAALLLGKPPYTNQSQFYWESHFASDAAAARLGSWKGILPQASGPIEIYDLVADPEETQNLAPKRPDLVAQFQAWFKDHQRPWSPPADGAAQAAGRPGYPTPTNVFKAPMRTNYLPSVPAKR